MATVTSSLKIMGEMQQPLMNSVKDIIAFTNQVLAASGQLNVINDSLQTQVAWQEQVLDISGRIGTSMTATAELAATLDQTGQAAAGNIEQAFENQAEKTETGFIRMSRSFDEAMTKVNDTATNWAGKLEQAGSFLDNASVGMQTLLAYSEQLINMSFEEMMQGLASAIDNIKMPKSLSEGLAMARDAASSLMGKLDQAESFLGSASTGVQNLITYSEQLSQVSFLSGISESMTAMLTGVQNGLSIATTVVGNVKGALSGVISIIDGVSKATQTWSTIQGALNVIMAANPIILIVLAVIALIAVITLIITYLVHLWKTNDQFAAALLGAWNAILNFFDQIPVFFWQLVEWMMNPFIMWAESIGKIYDAVINSIIEGINYVLKLVNKVTGSSFEIEGRFNSADMARDIQAFARSKKEAAMATAAKNVARREQNRQNMLDSRAADRAQKAQEEEEKQARVQIQNQAAQINQAQFNQAQVNQSEYNQTNSQTRNYLQFENQNHLQINNKNQLQFQNQNQTQIYQTVENYITIEQKSESQEQQSRSLTVNGPLVQPAAKPVPVAVTNTVDITNDDLKLMRDLAEMKNIQNFVSLTPTVQVTHTGDIRQESDIDTIVAHITDQLNNEIASSAKGVYGM